MRLFFIASELKFFPILLLLMIVPIFCTAVNSSVNHADFLAHITCFSLIGACLLRTDKNSAFHVEKFIFDSECVHLKFSISVLRTSKNAEFSKIVNGLYLIEL